MSPGFRISRRIGYSHRHRQGGEDGPWGGTPPRTKPHEHARDSLKSMTYGARPFRAFAQKSGPPRWASSAGGIERPHVVPEGVRGLTFGDDALDKGAFLDALPPLTGLAYVLHGFRGLTPTAKCVRSFGADRGAATLRFGT